MTDNVTQLAGDMAYPASQNSQDRSSSSTSTKIYRILAGSMVAYALYFLFNNYLIFFRKWPGPINFLKHKEWFGFAPLQKSLSPEIITLGWIQFFGLFAILLLAMLWVNKTQNRSLHDDARLWSGFSAYIIRTAFWAVLLIGFVDVFISFLRVEDFLDLVVGKELASALGRSNFRGTYVLYPLLGVGAIIAIFSRGLGFIWLSLLVVIAEFLIVITRFIFSYEQAYMGDLVRFWYAGLFLFASAYGIVSDGHVRVDVLYSIFNKHNKAISNTVGSLLLGMPLCWTILLTGMWTRGSSLNGPLLSFEIYQQGYGMYVKYLMVGFLVIFALSMLVQFVSYTLENIAELNGEVTDLPPPDEPIL